MDLQGSFTRLLDALALIRDGQDDQSMRVYDRMILLWDVQVLDLARPDPDRPRNLKLTDLGKEVLETRQITLHANP